MPKSFWQNKPLRVISFSEGKTNFEGKTNSTTSYGNDNSLEEEIGLLLKEINLENFSVENSNSSENISESVSTEGTSSGSSINPEKVSYEDFISSEGSSESVEKINSIENTGKQILSNDELLESIAKDFNHSNMFLQYKIYWTNDDVSRYKMKSIVKFINTNYISSNDLIYKLHYSTDLIKFYYDDPDTFIMEFSFFSNPAVVIGYIIGKKEMIVINGSDPFEILEANFLCLLPKFRNRGLTACMLNILIVETVLEFNIGIAHYTISSPIKSPHYCHKKVFHRPINIPLLVKTKFFNKDTDVDLYKKFYNSFDYAVKDSVRVKMVSGDLDKKLIKYLYTKYLNYCKKTYDIYELVSEDKFTKTFTYKSFYNFVIKDNTNTIVAYTCFYRLDTKNTDLYINSSYKNGYLYYTFFNSNDKDHIISVLEAVAMYIYSNGIFDILTYVDIFDFVTYSKIIEGSGELKYYLFNYEINSIENHRNALITI
jgi:hypothetical protein